MKRLKEGVEEGEEVAEVEEVGGGRRMFSLECFEERSGDEAEF